VWIGAAGALGNVDAEPFGSATTVYDHRLAMLPVP
jgi:hypothetical protein